MVGMSAVSLRKASLPLLAFLSTSFLLFLAYSGSEHPHERRFRYPDIPPPGASDKDRLRYSKSPIFPLPQLFSLTQTFLENRTHSQRTKSNMQRNMTSHYGSNNLSRSRTSRWKTPCTMTWEPTSGFSNGTTQLCPARTTTASFGSRWKGEKGNHSRSRYSTN